ncbi:MAG: LacI family DNA-binding transcriptional regulator [Propionibacteriaceae bacterium]|jgi:LacI family transcriptional regulator|nr:LacI family DNA-binding transcriptional regulator [Propionibacteriaceae bacterium]
MAEPSSHRRVTLDDVAQVAEVSKSTVSKALNNRSDVSESTRQRVLEAVAELGYESTTAPKSSSTTVVAVFDALESPYISNVLRGILTTATTRKANLLVRMPPEREVRLDADVAREWISEQHQAGVAGIIGLTLALPTSLLAEAERVGLPFVMIDPVDTHDRTVVSVGSANWSGARSAAEHLLELGHRRIGIIAGPKASDAAIERFHGYQAALDSAGIPRDEALVRYGQFSIDSGASDAADLLSLKDRPTAIIAGDDEIAVGVLRAARTLGVNVPTDLSVVGFDDTPQAMWTNPRLTSVHQPLTSMGRVAVETILTMAAGHAPVSTRIELTTSLTVRESTGPAPATESGDETSGNI